MKGVTHVNILIEHIGGLATLIGSLTVVGSALLWIYNKFIGNPREKRREKQRLEEQELMVKTITKENIPLNNAIKELNRLLDESKLDRDKLNGIADVNTETLKKHSEVLHRHDDRLIVLETKNGIRYKRGDD